MIESVAIQNSTETTTQEIYEEFKEFITSGNHPCLMAQSVFSSNHLDFKVYSEFGSQATARQLYADLKGYLEAYNTNNDLVYSFIAVFEDQPELSEVQFEKLLWQQLQKLHEVDNVKWDPEVESDPNSAEFSFSVGGKAFYMVGMHPNSSRKSRQAPYPSIAFNLHQQFEKLREKGSYEQVKKRIRKRDKALQGSINPMLADFHDASEARQYSGRKVGEEWKCPFLHKK